METEGHDPLLEATWSDLEEYFGAKTLTRGKGYQSSGRVNEVVRVEPDCILGRVSGSRTYAVRVELDRPEDGWIPVTDCTCPVGMSCKHAVALILEYIARMRDSRSIRELTEWTSIQGLFSPGSSAIVYDSLGKLLPCTESNSFSAMVKAVSLFPMQLDDTIR